MTIHDDALELFRRLTDSDVNEIDVNKLSSAKKARFFSWCIENDFNHVQLSESHSSNENVDTIKNENANDLEGFSVGIDIQVVEDISPANVTEWKSSKELERVFSIRELSYAEASSSPCETLAGIFAAKESLIKAGVVSQGDNMASIEVDHNIHGKPIFPGYSLSIAHDGGYAVAVAVKNTTFKMPQNYTPDQSGSEESSRAIAESVSCNSKTNYKILVINAIVTVIIATSISLIA